MECVALKLVSWRMSPFKLVSWRVALKLVSTAFCQVCFTACSLKFIFMAYVALFLTACVASQISFMACVALKLVFAAFFTKVRFQGV